MVHREPGSRLLVGQQLAVLGLPIEHSKSPLIHRAAYAELGLDWEYSALSCDVDALHGRLETSGPEWTGLSLTMPLKEEAHRLAAILDSVAQESGVVNTLLRLSGDAGWAGFNTDVAGLAAAIARAGTSTEHTIVIGSGATAVSAILAARTLGARRISVLARNPDAAAALISRFDGSSARVSSEPICIDTLTPAALRADPSAEGLTTSGTLVISTLPGPASSGFAVPDALTRIPLFDVAYDPWPSPLAQRWRAAGGQTFSGLGMLVEQAIVQIRIFLTGNPATLLPGEDRVRTAMRSALDAASMGD